jgi:integrase
MSVSPRGAGFEVYVKRGGSRYRVMAKTEAQGQAMEKEILACIEAGRSVDVEAIKEISESGKKTLRQAIDLTYNMRWRGQKAGDTQKLNADVCARHLGETTALEAIDVEDIDGLVERLQEAGNSDATINRKMSALRVIFEMAVARKWITEAPELPHKKEGKGRIRWLQDGEEEALLDMTRRLGKGDEADLWLFLVDTGARVREALKLGWGDLQNGRATFWETKNGEPRTIPLTQRVLAMLARRRGEPRPFDFDYPQARHTWDRVRGLLGFAEDTQWVIHMLRHTCASRLVQRGVPLLVVKEWMGHKSVQMTMRYAHLAPSNLDAAVAVLNPPAAPVAELADAVGLGPTAERHGGSSPSGRTKPQLRIA